MNFSFHFPITGTEELADLLPVFTAVAMALGVSGVFRMMFQLACYVFRSIGLYAVSGRRGLNRPWLAWIPVGNDWILGSLNDQYQYLAQGKITGKRKVLLGLRLAVMGIRWVCCAMIAVLGVQIIGADHWSAALLKPAIGFLFVILALGLASIVLKVFVHICRYYFFQSCDPRNGLAYMILGLVFPILDAVFFFICRNKDDGMPVKEQESPVEPEVYDQPIQEPWEAEPEPEIIEETTEE